MPPVSVNTVQALWNSLHKGWVAFIPNGGDVKSVGSSMYHSSTNFFCGGWMKCGVLTTTIFSDFALCLNTQNCVSSFRWAWHKTEKVDVATLKRRSLTTEKAVAPSGGRVQDPCTSIETMRWLTYLGKTLQAYAYLLCSHIEVEQKGGKCCKDVVRTMFH